MNVSCLNVFMLEYCYFWQFYVCVLNGLVCDYLTGLNGHIGRFGGMAFYDAVCALLLVYIKDKWFSIVLQFLQQEPRWSYIFWLVMAIMRMVLKDSRSSNKFMNNCLTTTIFFFK